MYTESPVGLRITAAVRTFQGFDALDWVVELENLAAADAPILQDILPLDTTFAIRPTENAYLHYAKGRWRCGGTAYWIDACWYGQGRPWWEEVGNWTINRRRYPRGLRPVADAAHARGMKFVLWFEPARVRQDSALAEEHPDYVLRCPQDPDQALLDFGNPHARRHMLEVFSNIIAEAGVDVYREDFNFDPLPYWQAADAPDRVGLAEIRFIEGHYAFWDELRRRFDHLAIDNCASATPTGGP